MDHRSETFELEEGQLKKPLHVVLAEKLPERALKKFLLSNVLRNLVLLLPS